jgi:ABC-2 type transport system permease protein
MSLASALVRPGSLRWLLANEARLASRRLGDLMPRLSHVKRRLVLVAAALVLHLAAWPAARWVSKAAADPERNGLVWGGLIAVLGFATSWMLAQSLLNVTRSLYVRGDFDLMLSSPMPGRKVAAARMASLTVENFGSAAFFILPVAHALALQGQTQWLGLYPLLGALAMIAAAFGLAASLTLFRVIGARRARSVAQIIAMLIGAAVALGIQLLAVIPKEWRASVMERLAMDGLDGVSWQAHPLGLVLGAVRGELAPILVLISAGFLLLVLAVRVLSPVYMSSVLRSAGADLTPRRKPTAAARAIRFRSDPASSIRVKELKLLARDPWIAGQLVLQVVYTLPVALILWRSGIGQAIPAVAVTPSLVIIAAQISGSLAWIAISGEDAPEFMATAPVAQRGIERRKLEVIALIVGGMLLVPLALLAWSAPLAGLIALVACIAAGTSCALVNLWHPSDGRRRAFMRRHAQSKLIGLFEHGLLLLIAVAAALAQMHTAVAIVPAVLALLVLWLAHWLLKGRRPPPVPVPASAPAVATA